MRFFKKIQDWILKSERIRKLILRFFTRQINPRSFGSWCVKGTEESSLEVGLICLVKKRKIYFRIPSDFRIQSWILLQKRTVSNLSAQKFLILSYLFGECLPPKNSVVQLIHRAEFSVFYSKITLTVDHVIPKWSQYTIDFPIRCSL